MPRFPIEYDVELERPPASPMELHAGARPALLVGPPPEFGGMDMVWSPEHLLVSAAASCFTATLMARAERANLRLGSLRVRAKGMLDKTPNGVVFTSIHLALQVDVIEDDAARVGAVVDEAKRYCFVANSLRCPVDVSLSTKVC